MLLGEFNVLVVVAFFVVVAIGVRIVDYLTSPRRDRRRATVVGPRVVPARGRATQLLVAASPVEKRKPTPGSVST